MGTCHLFFFIDAMGAAITGAHPEMREIAPHFRALRSVLGYSSACVPSILTGRMPEDHGHWSYFTHQGEGDGLTIPGWIRAMPGALRDRGRVRSHLSRAIAKRNGIEGYFQLYQLPIAHAHNYGHCEPRNIFTPGGINNGTSIIDTLAESGQAAFVSDWHQTTDQNWAALNQAVADPECSFGLMYDAHLDGWLHDHTKDDADLPNRLLAIRERIETAVAIAEANHDQVFFYVFSDHGMCTIREHRNVLPVLEGTGLRLHDELPVIVDSTMVRTWYRNRHDREIVRDALADVAGLRLLSVGELAAEGCQFPDSRFGDDIFLADPGVLLVPSHMGTKPIAGMHGYHPDHVDSDATFLTNDPEADPHGIVDLYDLMQRAVSRTAMERAA